MGSTEAFDAGLDRVDNVHTLKPVSVHSDDYTLTIDDTDLAHAMTKGSATTLTIPSNADVPFPIGTEFPITQDGAGQVNVVVDTDTLNTALSSTLTRAQYSELRARKVAATEWRLTGDAQ